MQTLFIPIFLHSPTNVWHVSFKILAWRDEFNTQQLDMFVVPSTPLVFLVTGKTGTRTAVLGPLVAVRWQLLSSSVCCCPVQIKPLRTWKFSPCSQAVECEENIPMWSLVLADSTAVTVRTLLTSPHRCRHRESFWKSWINRATPEPWARFGPFSEIRPVKGNHADGSPNW